MKIALVNPPKKKERAVEAQPPLGLGYLASSVEKIANIEIIDAIRDNLSPGNLIKELIDKKFDVIGFQVFTFDFNVVKGIIKELRKDCSKSILIVGGPHPSLDPINTSEKIGADYVFVGESEMIFPIFINNLKKGVRNPKIIFPPHPVENLDDYGPSWDLFYLKKYPVAPHNLFYKQSPIFPIITSRGCPFRCTYCGAHNIFGHRIRRHSVDFVIKQIDFLVKKYGAKEIHIEDDNFTMDKEFVKKFCNELMKRDYGIAWTCPNGVRIDTLDKELLNSMKKSGLYSLCVGIETGSDRIRKLMKKNLNSKVIEEKIKLISECGIEIMGFFMIGYPEETVEEINRTINFACKLDIQRASFNIVKPFPGTEIYNQLISKGELKEIEYDNFSPDEVVYSSNEFTSNELKKLRKKALIKFYLRPKIALGLLWRIRSLQNFKNVLTRIFRVFKKMY